jgi:ATP-grasp domain, R2K clade family 3
MRPTWLIEGNVEGMPTEPLQAEVRRQGMTCWVVKHLPSLARPKDIAGSESLAMDACVVFRGTLTLMRHILASRRWSPGGWCNFQNLACSSYYAHFGPFLLNREYTFLPIAEAVRLADNLFARYAKGGQVFVRPDSVDKSFTGTLTDRSMFGHQFFGATFDPATLILVSRAKKLTREWRLIVANGKVITGSQYREVDEHRETPGYPEEVLAFATTVLNSVSWRPAPMFIMDICDSEDGLRLLELNSFGCSGHYLADLRIVVEIASDLASSAW